MSEPPPTESGSKIAYDAGQLGGVAELLRSSAHPQQIGPYRILEVIGQGGMGVVYKAEQRTPIQRLVALKVIKLGMDTVEFIARFESERQALAMMNHPNVARVYDAGATETGRPYLVMEYVPGEPITVYADRHQLETRQRLELFIQACEAIQHAHQKAIIHRDLKPSNILVALVDGKPQVKVIDFGVAKALSQRLTERTMFTQTGQLIGTPEYMSPEQARSGDSDIDTRTDIYSLGVVLYELLIGTLPMDPKTLRSAAYAEIQRIIHELEPPRPSTRLSGLGNVAAIEIAKRRRTEVEALARQLRSELEWIPLKAMRKERTDRYRTAVELAEDIRNYLSNRPLIAAPESPAYRLRKLIRRNRTTVAAVTAVLLALAVGVGTTVWQAFRATRAERATRTALNEVQARSRELEQSLAANRAINDFLTEDILHSADPSVARGEERTIKQAVDDAARSIDEQFKDQPLVAASIRSTLAITYDGLGRPELGLPHAQWALEQRRKILGNDHAETISAMDTVVTLLESLGKTDGAESLAKEAVERSRRALGSADRTTITAVSNMGHLLHAEGKLKEAEPFYREALDDCRKAFGETNPETLTALNNVASVLLTQGKAAEAEPMFRQQLELQRRVLPEPDNHPDHIIAISNLAKSLQQQRKFEEAERLDRQALALARRVFKDDHPSTLIIVRNLGDVCHDRGKLEESETLLREALVGMRRTLSDDHPQTLAAMNSLASVLEARGKLDEAIALYREALERCRNLIGPDHANTITAMNNLGHVLATAGHFDQAEPLFAESYRRAATAQMDPAMAAAAMSRWGSCLVELGQYDKAEAPLRESEQRLRAAGMETSGPMVQVLNALVTVCEHTNRPDEASRYRAESEKIKPRPASTQSSGR